MGVQIPSTFPKSLDFKPFQPKVRVLPWQMKSTRILIKTPFKLRCPAAICSDLRDVNSSLCIGHFCTKNAKLSKILQDVYSNRSRNGVELLTNYYFISKQLLYDCFYALTVCICFFQNHYIYKCPCNLIQNTMDSFYFSWISMRDSISKISKYITSIIS